MGVRTRVQVFAVAVIGTVVCLAGTALAGPPNDALQVADLNPGAAPSSHLDGPGKLTAAGSKVFFTASAGNGLELYVSDGTAAGTHITKDINPAPNASSNPTDLTAVGDTLFFQANDGTNGAELWKSDGTAAGTVMVKDINTETPGAASTPTSLTNFNGTLFFAATPDSGLIGRELWKSDGTSAGTVQVGDISTAPGGSSPQELTKVGNALFFSAEDFFDRELYKSDGSTVTLVQSINPSGSGNPTEITGVNGVAYFSATDGTNGRELWKTNAAGTSASMVEDLNPGVGNSNPGDFAAIGDTVYFRATDVTTGRELYKSDGSGVDLVKDIAPGNSQPQDLTNVGGTLVFSAFGADGQELWRSDGTEDGTTQVKDINPGPANSYPTDLTSVGGTLYFGAYNTVNGGERWRSDGTGPGTVPIEDIEPGTGDSLPPTAGNPVAGAGSTVYFSAFQTGSGFELWKYADTIPPTVTIDSGPAADSTITTGSPTFGFSSDDSPSTFQCRLYASGSTPPAFGACSGASSHTPASSLADGSYTFDVRGTDSGGNVGSASRAFTVALPTDPGGDDAACKKARAALEAAEKKLAKAKAALKKAKKSKKSAKVKKAKAKVKKAKGAVKSAKADVADAC